MEGQPMETQSKTVCLQTEKKQELIDLTALLNETIRNSGVRNGLAGVYSQHTTAALLVGECQSALVDDVLDFLTRIVDDGLNYKHNCPELSDCERKNAASHLRGLLLNHSVMVPVMDGKPVLGQFQSILFAELDGPRQRSVHIQLVGDAACVPNYAGRFAEGVDDRDIWRGQSESRRVRYLR
jgi:secondary thiamine-phosphate synthase enzyme